MDVEQDHPHPAPDESSSFAPQQQQQQRTSHAAAAAALAASAVPNSAGTEGTSGATNKEQQRPLRIAVHPVRTVLVLLSIVYCYLQLGPSNLFDHLHLPSLLVFIHTRFIRCVHARMNAFSFIHSFHHSYYF